MKIVLDEQEIENLACDVWFKVDAIVHSGIELADCKQDGRIRYLRSLIDSDSCVIYGMFMALRRLGLRSVCGILSDKIRKRLSSDRSGYQHKVDVYAFSAIHSFLR